jgi:DNA-binding response OmpR family regulator
LSADLVRLREILAPRNRKLNEASDCCETLASLRRESVPRAAARQPDPPNLIVFSRLADEYLSARVLNIGGFDLLVAPFEPEEVLRVASAAWSRCDYDFAVRTAKEAETAYARKSIQTEENLNHA